MHFFANFVVSVSEVTIHCCNRLIAYYSGGCFDVGLWARSTTPCVLKQSIEAHGIVLFNV